MLLKTIVALSSFAGVMSAAGIGPEVPLWPSGAPGSEGITAKENVEQPNEKHDYVKVWSIHQPSLTVFLPDKEKRATAAAGDTPFTPQRTVRRCRCWEPAAARSFVGPPLA